MACPSARVKSLHHARVKSPWPLPYPDLSRTSATRFRPLAVLPLATKRAVAGCGRCVRVQLENLPAVLHDREVGGRLMCFHVEHVAQ